jgi:oxygen-independent coproporphyrinogen-3 oxidase
MTAAGIYIHIPFCRSRCSYCDFATGIYESELASAYVQAIGKEIREWQRVETPPTVDTIYFGGGTPSTLSPDQLRYILATVYDRFTVSSSAEITLEMNPGALSLGTIQAFRELGINRASFGAQTFDDRELARLGRSHTVADTHQTFADLRKAGFDNVNFDLIAGLPGQTLSGWRRNIETAISMRPEHLSFYLLEVHEGTPLAEHIRAGKQPKPDDDLAVKMYELMLERSFEAGYEHYEISNLCLPGFESRHNTKYWTGATYYGFGCSAHSYDGSLRRWANQRDIGRYISAIEANESPIAQTWELSEHDRRSEKIFLGLRLMKGISLREYEASFGEDIRKRYRDDFERFLEAGLIEEQGDFLKLTRTGALLSNEVFSAFA